MVINKINFGETDSHFTRKPYIMDGGFTLDWKYQNFNIGDIISAGTLAIMNTETQKLRIVKTAEVMQIGDDPRKLYLKSFPYHDPCFVIGEHIYIADKNVNFIDAPQIVNIQNIGAYILTLSEPIENISEGVIIQQVVNTDGIATSIGKANCVTVRDVEITYKDSSVDVTANTDLAEVKTKLIPPIPESQRDSRGYLSANPHVKLTNLL